MSASTTAPEGAVYPSALPYRQRVVLMFQRIDGVDVCIFALYTQEYGANCPAPNTNSLYVAYLDSVRFMRPLHARTPAYREILKAYLEHARRNGFRRAFIWACPPQRGDAYIFHRHPPQQRTPTKDRLRQWYEDMLREAQEEGAVTRVNSLFDEYFDDDGTLRSDAGLPPFFKGDFWATETERVVRDLPKEVRLHKLVVVARAKAAKSKKSGSSKSKSSSSRSRVRSSKSKVSAPRPASGPAARATAAAADAAAVAAASSLSRSATPSSTPSKAQPNTRGRSPRITSAAATPVAEALALPAAPAGSQPTAAAASGVASTVNFVLRKISPVLSHRASTDPASGAQPEGVSSTSSSSQALQSRSDDIKPAAKSAHGTRASLGLGGKVGTADADPLAALSGLDRSSSVVSSRTVAESVVDGDDDPDGAAPASVSLDDVPDPDVWTLMAARLRDLKKEFFVAHLDPVYPPFDDRVPLRDPSAPAQPPAVLVAAQSPAVAAPIAPKSTLAPAGSSSSSSSSASALTPAGGPVTAVPVAATKSASSTPSRKRPRDDEEPAARPAAGSASDADEEAEEEEDDDDDDDDDDDEREDMLHELGGRSLASEGGAAEADDDGRSASSRSRRPRRRAAAVADRRISRNLESGRSRDATAWARTSKEQDDEELAIATALERSREDAKLAQAAASEVLEIDDDADSTRGAASDAEGAATGPKAKRLCMEEPTGEAAAPVGASATLAPAAPAAEGAPPLAVSESSDVACERLSCSFFDTRNGFLRMCQANNYQFDTLRRAKHSSAVIIWHLHNPSIPATDDEDEVPQGDVVSQL